MDIVHYINLVHQRTIIKLEAGLSIGIEMSKISQ